MTKNDRFLQREENRNLRDNADPHSSSDSNNTMNYLKFSARGLLIFVGVMIMVIGIVYAMMLFNNIYDILNQPKGFADTFTEWQERLGGRELDITVGNNKLPCANFLAIAVLGCGYIMLFWLTLRIILTGTKILMLVSDDKKEKSSGN